MTEHFTLSAWDSTEPGSLCYQVLLDRRRLFHCKQEMENCLPTAQEPTCYTIGTIFISLQHHNFFFVSLQYLNRRKYKALNEPRAIWGHSQGSDCDCCWRRVILLYGMLPTFRRDEMPASRRKRLFPWKPWQISLMCYIMEYGNLEQHVTFVFKSPQNIFGLWPI